MWDLNTSRATNEEVFQAEFFKHGIHSLIDCNAHLFNYVVCSRFLKAWSHHTIHLIHKLGFMTKSNNYRMIMVGHTFSKLFAATLHLWLLEELVRHQLRAKGQASLCLQPQTTNHILTLIVTKEEVSHRPLKVSC